MVEAATEFEKLSQCHAVKPMLAVQCSVEEAGSVVGQVMGHVSVKSITAKNGAR